MMARTRAQDYDDKRLLILRRSARLFARHGYVGASITKIADACGTSKALLYHYYPDKASMLFDILFRHLTGLVEAVEAAAARPAAPRGRVTAIAEALLEAYRDADAEHQVQLTSLQLLPADKQEVLKDLERRLVALASDAIGAAIPEPAPPREVLRPLAMSFFGMLNWHYLWFRDGKGLTRGDYARMASALVLSGARDAVDALEHRPARPRRPARDADAQDVEPARFLRDQAALPDRKAR